MTHSQLIDGVAITSDSDSRGGKKVSHFIVHHAATTSLNALLADFAPGGREVSANYALGADGTLILTVDEDRSAWTSASWYDDISITIEVCNDELGGSWPVSDASFDKLARLIADVSLRYGFPINDDTVLTHQELWTRFRESYPTACPGDLQRRKAELLALANQYRNGIQQDIRTDDDEMLSPEAQNYLDTLVTTQVNRAIDAIRRESRTRLYQKKSTGQIIGVNWDLPVGTPGRVLYNHAGPMQVTRWASPYQIVGDSANQAIVLEDADFDTLIRLVDGSDSSYSKEA